MHNNFTHFIYPISLLISFTFLSLLVPKLPELVVVFECFRINHNREFYRFPRICHLLISFSLSPILFPRSLQSPGHLPLWIFFFRQEDKTNPDDTVSDDLKNMWGVREPGHQGFILGATEDACWTRSRRGILQERWRRRHAHTQTFPRSVTQTVIIFDKVLCKYHEFDSFL